MTKLLFVLAVVILQVVIRAILKKAEQQRAAKAAAGLSPLPKASVTQPVSKPASPPNAVASPVRVVRADTSKTTVVRAKARVSAPSQPPRVPAQVEAQLRAQMDAKVRADAEARAERARAGGKRAAASHVKPLKAALAQRPAEPSAEEFDALHSRERVQESVAKIRAAEMKVAMALPGQTRSQGRGGAAASPIAASIRGLLRDPRRVREAFILSEILGPPQSAQDAASGVRRSIAPL